MTQRERIYLGHECPACGSGTGDIEDNRFRGIKASFRCTEAHSSGDFFLPAGYEAG